MRRDDAPARVLQNEVHLKLMCEQFHNETAPGDRVGNRQADDIARFNRRARNERGSVFPGDDQDGRTGLSYAPRTRRVHFDAHWCGE